MTSEAKRRIPAPPPLDQAPKTYKQLATELTQRLTRFEDFLINECGPIETKIPFPFTSDEGAKARGHLHLRRNTKPGGQKWALMFAKTYELYLPDESSFVRVADADLNTKILIIDQLSEFWEAYQCERNAKRGELVEALDGFDNFARKIGLRVEGL